MCFCYAWGGSSIKDSRRARTMASLICLTPIGLNHWCMLMNRLDTIFKWCLWPATAAAVVGIGYVADRQPPTDDWWCCGATAPVVSTVNGVVAAASCTRPTPVARGSGIGFSSTTMTSTALESRRSTVGQAPLNAPPDFDHGGITSVYLKLVPIYIRICDIRHKRHENFFLILNFFLRKEKMFLQISLNISADTTTARIDIGTTNTTVRTRSTTESAHKDSRTNTDACACARMKAAAAACAFCRARVVVRHIGSSNGVRARWEEARPAHHPRRVWRRMRTPPRPGRRPITTGHTDSRRSRRTIRQENSHHFRETTQYYTRVQRMSGSLLYILYNNNNDDSKNSNNVPYNIKYCRMV